MTFPADPARPESRLASVIRWGSFTTVIGLFAVALGGCDSKPKPGTIRISRQNSSATTPTTSTPPSSPNLPTESADDAVLHDPVYQTFVRPLLTKKGCTTGQCHGKFKGGGLFITRPSPTDPTVYKTVLLRVDRKNPEQSELVLKATNKLQHNGGKNIAEGSCDYRRLIAWIGQKPDPACNDEPPADPARFARELMPALDKMGCAAKSCHGGAGPASLKFNLITLRDPKPVASQAQIAFDSAGPNHIAAWMSKVVRAADGVDGIHSTKIDYRSCAYRRLYGFMTNAPELTCDLESNVAPPLPDLEVYATKVMPMMQKRGCFESSCHASGAGDMPMFEITPSAPTARNNLLVLAMRVENFADIENSTLLRTARNLEPHGGGQRLGGKGDCMDEMISAWLRGQPVKSCPPPTPPTYERYVAEIQPTIDKMTCSNMKCHGRGIATFLIVPEAKDPAVLRKNYEATLRFIDLEFMPFSEVQLRMREPCAYATVGAWIERKPKPNCVVQTPDPKIFPRVDKEGNPIHLESKPGPPPDTKI